MKSRLRLNTWMTEQTIIEKKIMPYFKEQMINEIKPTHIIACQNEIMNLHDKFNITIDYIRKIYKRILSIYDSRDDNDCNIAKEFGVMMVKMIYIIP